MKTTLKRMNVVSAWFMTLFGILQASWTDLHLTKGPFEFQTLAPRSGTLFGNRVLTDVGTMQVTVRPYCGEGGMIQQLESLQADLDTRHRRWSCENPYSDTDRRGEDRGKCHRKMEAEGGGTDLQAKEQKEHGHRKLRQKHARDSPHRAFRESRTLPTF